MGQQYAKESAKTEVISYSLTDPRQLREFILAADVRLVRAEYFWELSRDGRTFIRRQEAEKEVCEDGRPALVAPEEWTTWESGRDALIMSVSHCWETCEHPDPCGHQLELIASCTALYFAACSRPIWVFYDYISLFQWRRDDSEERSYQAAMKDMQLLYAHEHTYTLRVESLTPEHVWQRNLDRLVTMYHASRGFGKVPLRELERAHSAPYRARGWCQAELEFSSCRSETFRNQAIDRGSASVQSGKEVRDLKGKVPVKPEHFLETMEGLRFTHGDDRLKVLQMQEKVYQQKVTDCETAIFEHLTSGELMALAASLPDFLRLKHLGLRDFDCGKTEAEELGKVLRSSTALEQLEIRQTHAAESQQNYSAPAPMWLQALVEALEINMSVASLDLAGCFEITNKGAEALAAALQKNTTLTHIDLAHSQIGNEGVQALADALAVNGTLVSISLAGQKYIQDQGAEALAEALKKNKTLADIDLSGTHIGMEGVQALAQALVVNVGLTSISFARCRFIDHRAAEALADALIQNKSLRSMSLAGCEIGDEGAQALAKMLTVNETLTSLDLAGRWRGRLDIGNQGAQALAESLALNNSLTSINLAGCSIRDEILEAVAEALTVNSSLASDEPSAGLYLQESELQAPAAHASETGDGPTWKALFEMLQKNSAPSKIAFAPKQLGVEEAKAFAKALEVNTVLTAIELTECGEGILEVLAEALKTNLGLTDIKFTSSYVFKDTVGPSAGQALAEALKANKVLKSLSFKSSPIGVQAAQALANALKDNSALTDITVLYSDISGDGVQALAAALKTNTALKSLSFQGSSIGAQGVQAIAAALRETSTLTSVGLVDRGIETSGAQAMADALKANATLTSLRFDVSGVGAEGLEALVNALTQSTTLTSIDIVDRQMHGEGAEAVVRALSMNASLKSFRLEVPHGRGRVAQALAEALEENSSVTSLDLINCGIECGEAQALAGALKINKAIKYLRVQCADLGAEGAQALAEAMAENSDLTSMELESCFVEDDGAQALVEAFIANPSLTSLTIDDESMSQENVQALKAELAEGGVPHINLELPHDGGDVAEEAVADDEAEGIRIRLEARKTTSVP